MTISPAHVPALETAMPSPHTAPSPLPARVPGAPVTPLPLDSLARFSQLMKREGWPVDLARMVTDSAYALDRLAQAHTSSDATLRRAALALFDTYDRNAGAMLQH